MSSTQLKTAVAAEEQKLLACIHCGLCLEACPTYVVTGNENDSPRGRIYLMRAVSEGRLANNSTAFQQHLDRCLGCRACEQVCPAGVEYGELLESGRAELFASGARKSIDYKLVRWALKHLWLYPPRLQTAFALARLLRDLGVTRLLIRSRIAATISRRFEFGLALLESSARIRLTVSDENISEARLANKSPQPLQDQGSASLFKGCVGEGLFSRVNNATARVLGANGFKVSIPEKQVCCGALHAHAGDLEGACVLARRNIEAFEKEGESSIVTSAGGCGAMLTTYGHLLDHDEQFAARARKFSARVRDVSQQLGDTRLKQGASLGPEVTTYDASCHLIYGQHAGTAPLELLKAIPDLSFSELHGSERCCGGAGIYNLLEPELSQEVLAEKLANIEVTGARILATGNPGCQMQIGAGALLAGMELRVCHPVELLDESYRRAGVYDTRLDNSS